MTVVISDDHRDDLMQNQRTLLANMVPDEELVIRSQAGDSTAFAELVHRHYQSALRLGVTILRNREDAQDEVQNAFAKAFEHIRDFQRGCRFSSWLTRIVVNQCLMRIRQRRRSRVAAPETANSFEEQPAPFEFPDSSALPDRELAAAQVRAVLEAEVRRIPPLLRVPFILRHVEELPISEVAARLGISVAAAKSRLFRARLELQNRLARHQGRLGPATLTAS